MRKLIVLFLLAITTAVIGCGTENSTGNSPAESPKKPAASLDDQSDRDWLYRSQYKSHMRHMWIDANRIVSAGRGDLEPTWYEIRASAGDIRRRAELISGFWSDIVKRIEEIEWCADDDDRMGAANEFRALGASCDGCHMATWSPAYLHVTNSIIDGWLTNQPTNHQADEQDAEPPPAIPNRETMKKLFFHYSMAEMRIEEWQPEALKKSLAEILPEAKLRAERWKTVADNAKKLEESAAARQRDGLKDAYNAMTQACLACHGVQAGYARDILIPMPWEGPVK